VILIVGLGNPGERYADTRHNIGFRVVERLFARGGGTHCQERFQGRFSLAELAKQRAGLLKPLTFMNLSGASVQQAMSFYKVDLGSLLVIHDELDVAFGELRLKLGGGDAGHRGVRSIAERLGTEAFARLRVGVGRPPPDFRGDAAAFVLEAFASAERPGVETLVDRAADAVELFVDRGLAAAMNATNQRQKR
jgi:peptidyl-tRNA hydrolase, PTH1 family